MPSIIDYAVAYFLYFLPSLTITFIALLIILFVFFYGKRENLLLMDNTFELLKDKNGDRVLNYELVERSTFGRTYLVDLTPELSLENFRVHFTLIKRHFVSNRVGSYIWKHKDYILIEADPKNKIVKRYQVEILPKNDAKRIKALTDMLSKLNKMEIGDYFSVWVNDQDFFKAVFQKNTQIIKKLYSQKEHIVRVSFYPLESPSIRIVGELSEGVRPIQLMDILFDMTNGIISLGHKGFYAKQKALRLIEDKTLEKERRFAEDRFKI